MKERFQSLMPKDAPPPGACVRIERPEPGLARLVLDPPHRKLAVLDVALMQDLERALDALSGDSGLVALVITGREPTSFAAGADIDALTSIDDAAFALELGRYGQGVFEKLARLKAFKVAAVGGPVPGGAFELALACDRIVLADHPSTKIGLPEVLLGILPGWGGSQRLPRRIGVPAALEAILAGRLFDARRALRLGLVDRLTWPEYLLRVASDIAMGRLRAPRYDRGAWKWLVDKNPLARALIRRKVLQEVRAKTRGHYPAPLEVIPLILAAPSTPLEVGLEHEAAALSRLMVSPVCKNLVSIFRLSEDAKRLGKLPGGGEAPKLVRVGVVGAGVMGAGIATVAAQKGLWTRLSDVDRAPLDRALHAHRANVKKDAARRRLAPHEIDAALDRLDAGVGLAGLSGSEIVIEAVAERLEVKLAVFGELARRLSPRAILATNTSSLSVDALAERLPHPERVVGMHFFNPVPQMPLVEVVRGARTSDEVVHAVARLALSLGKTPVITRDTAGFVVNRLLGPYLDEAARLFDAGVEVQEVDRVAKDFGLPMGPLELLDEVGLDIAAHAAESLQRAFGERMASSELLGRMLAAGLKGKKGGAGFYLHGEKQRVVNPDLARLRSAAGNVRHEFPEAAIFDHLLMAMLNEAALALEERVVAGPRELDLATVFGMGFPPFHGGLLRWADTLGPREVLGRILRLSASPAILSRPGGVARFKPAPLLRRVAEASGKFHAVEAEAPPR
ncbi:MAG: enoyl-CoA hydratase/isomerase family protein [Planctomycetes bacterium]|nr:enoyl-CoA hydratase/isomerase family protein [Planctomycetota bacterium]